MSEKQHNINTNNQDTRVKNSNNQEIKQPNYQEDIKSNYQEDIESNNQKEMQPSSKNELKVETDVVIHSNKGNKADKVDKANKANKGDNVDKANKAKGDNKDDDCSKKHNKKSLFPNKKGYKYTMLLLIFVLGFIIFPKLKTYLSGFLAAGTLYVLLRKQMYRLHEKRKWGRKISATVIVLEALFFILIPLTGISFLVADTLSSIKINPQEILRQILDFINSVEQRIGIDLFTVENLSFIPKASTTLVQNIITSISSLIINFIIAVFILYFMLIEYKGLETSIKEIIPLNPENKGILAKETNAIITANAIGIPLLGIIQGIFAYIGYLIVGVPNALIYAVLTAFASLLPIIGTMLIWVPITINFFITGNIKAGIIIGIYGFFIIGGVDNIARFLLQKKLADIHPLITVFGVLIGIPIFGFLGVIFGPLLLSLFILFINMYRYEFVPNSVAEPRVTMRKQDKGKKFKSFLDKNQKKREREKGKEKKRKKQKKK